MFVRVQVWQVCVETIPQVQTPPKFQGVSFGNHHLDTDTPQNFCLRLTLEAYESLNEMRGLLIVIRSRVDGGKVLCCFAYGGNCIRSMGFLHRLLPNIGRMYFLPAWVRSESLPSPCVSQPVLDLEMLEKLTEILLQVNNHLRMCYGCLEAVT